MINEYKKTNVKVKLNNNTIDKYEIWKIPFKMESEDFLILMVKLLVKKSNQKS